MSLIPTRPTNPKLRIGLRSWSQLERLCDQRLEGPVRLQLQSNRLMVGDALPVLLVLPNGFEARLRAQVVHLRPDPRGDTPVLTLELTSLSAQIAERLRALATPVDSSPASVPPPPSARADARVAAGTPSPEWPSPGWQKMLAKVRGRYLSRPPTADPTAELRTQIEGLAERMRRRNDEPS